MFIFYLILFHYIRSDYVSIDLIRFDLPDFWLGFRPFSGPAHPSLALAGSGKCSFVCIISFLPRSAIIEEIMRMSEAGLTSAAFFYFDLRDSSTKQAVKAHFLLYSLSYPLSPMLVPTSLNACTK